MIQLVSCITDQHDWLLLLVAVCVCTAGNLAGVFMLSRACQCVKAHRNLWLAVAGTVFGGTIWATHFIAMLAYSIPVSYQLVETGLSIVVAVAISCLATFTSIYVPGRRGAVAAGILMGLAIAFMHAIGLSAISSSALIQGNVEVKVVAWMLGVILGISAMLILAHRTTGGRLILAALLIVGAVCSHHMISMSGLTIVPLYSDTAGALTFVDRVGIAVGVCIVSSLLIATGVAALFFDQHLTDVKGLANATFEAVVLTRAGKIVHANERFAALTGRTVAELRSLLLSDFLIDRQRSHGVLAAPDGAVPVEIVEGIIEYRGCETSVFGLRDISERLETDRQLVHLAAHDPLTGLLNRRSFTSWSEQAIAEAVAEGSEVSLLTLDLDRFKSINDVYGHADGDLILQQVSDVLSASFDERAVLGRMGGDEFSVLLPGHPTFDAHQAASVFVANFKSRFGLHDKASALGVSVGIATSPKHGIDLKQLQNNADAALYRAKSLGKGLICAFDRFLDQQLRARRRLEEELRGAADAGELFLLYQPIVEAVSGEPQGYEALLRWRHPTYGVLSPAVFIESAEESGCIVEIGKWVLEEACMQAASWGNSLYVAVNVSARQLLSPDLINHVTKALEMSGLSADRLELEVTETSLLEDRAEIGRCLEALTAHGIKLVMDDYGRGHSSITNFRRHPFQKLKIDRSYVAALDEDPVAEVMIDFALALGKSFGLTVVVEGIETESQRVRLAAKAPDQLQGFLFGRPESMGRTFSVSGHEPQATHTPRPPINPTPVSRLKRKSCRRSTTDPGLCSEAGNSDVCGSQLECETGHGDPLVLLRRSSSHALD